MDIASNDFVRSFKRKSSRIQPNFHLAWGTHTPDLLIAVEMSRDVGFKEAIDNVNQFVLTRKGDVDPGSE